MAKKRNITLDKYIEILKKIRDKHNAGDYQMMVTSVHDTVHGTNLYFVNMQNHDTVVDNDEKFIAIDVRYVPNAKW